MFGQPKGKRNSSREALASRIPTFPVETELGDLQSEPDVLRLRSIPALSQIFRHWMAEGFWGGIMRSDHVEVSWDADKSNWLVRIKSGEEVIRRHCKLPAGSGRSPFQDNAALAAEPGCASDFSWTTP
jgi:hypothetical protein